MPSGSCRLQQAVRIAPAGSRPEVRLTLGAPLSGRLPGRPSQGVRPRAESPASEGTDPSGALSLRSSGLRPLPELNGLISGFLTPTSSSRPLKKSFRSRDRAFFAQHPRPNFGYSQVTTAFGRGHWTRNLVLSIRKHFFNSLLGTHPSFRGKPPRTSILPRKFGCRTLTPSPSELRLQVGSTSRSFPMHAPPDTDGSSFEGLILVRAGSCGFCGVGSCGSDPSETNHPVSIRPAAICTDAIRSDAICTVAICTVAIYPEPSGIGRCTLPRRPAYSARSRIELTIAIRTPGRVAGDVRRPRIVRWLTGDKRRTSPLGGTREYAP